MTPKRPHEDEKGVWVARWMLAEAPSGNAAVLFAQIAWLIQPGLRGRDRGRVVDRGGERWLATTDAELAEHLGVSDDAARRARLALKTAGMIATKSAKVEGIKRTLIQPIAEAPDSADPRNSSAAEAREGYSAEPPNSSFRGTAECTSLTNGEGERGEPDGQAEARRLCDLLAELMVANGCKPPNITKSWIDEMDRMMRLDGRTSENVENCIRWSQADSFWQANILSPKKLRAKYDQLRLAAKRQGATPATARSVERDRRQDLLLDEIRRHEEESA